MLIYVDIDGTICTTVDGKYNKSRPIWPHIKKINKLYDAGNTIIYWTARGAISGIDWTELTKSQLKKWGARHHDLRMNSKPHYDLLICDKTKRIEEL